MKQKTYKDHPAREVLSRIKSINSSPEMASPELASDEISSFARDKIFAIASLLGSLIEKTPAVLVSSQGLDQLHSNLQGPLSELTQYLSDKNFGHIQNAASQMEQNVLPMFWVFGGNAIPNGKSEIAELIEELQRSARDSISKIVEERDNLLSNIEDLKLSVDRQKEKIESLIEASSRDRSEAAAAVSNLERQFSEKEIERNAKFDAMMIDVSAQFSDRQNVAIKKANSFLEKIMILRDDAAKIVQVVGNIGVTGNYKLIAKSEAQQANFWRWATVAFFACGVGIAVATFVKFYASTIDGTNVWTVAIRLLYAIAITAPAFYTARESARHRSNSDRARQTELELASLGPFIELMPEEKKIEIREKLSQMYFGREVEQHKAGNLVDIEKFKEALVEIAKAVK